MSNRCAYITFVVEGVRNPGRLYSSKALDDIEEAARIIKDADSCRQLICYEVLNPKFVTRPKTPQTWHEYMLKQLDEGRHVGDREHCLFWFNEWAIINGLPQYDQGVEQAPAVSEPGPRGGKQKLLLAQDFVRQTDTSELERRAWAATMALCGER